MPGMMETVLNVGLNDESVQGLAKQTDNERFAWDSYRRLIQMFGKTVLDLDGEHFEDAIDAAKAAKGVTNDVDLDVADLKGLVTTFKGIVERDSGNPFPQDPRKQMEARRHRRLQLVELRPRRALPPPRAHPGRPRHRGQRPGRWPSATRAWTPAPASPSPATRRPGAVGVYGDYLQNAQGEDVVAGIRNTLTLADLEGLDKKSYDELLDIMARLEDHYRDMCDIEFTIERGKLWMLQTRVGKRTAEAAFRIALDLVDEGKISEDEALQRVNGDQLAQLMFPHFDTSGERDLLGKGMSASPGAAVGQAVFSSARAVEMAEAGTPVILIRRETNPDDLPGMVAANGILTSRGGKTSHAAVVARGMGRTCVCGAESLDVDTKTCKFTTSDGTVVNEGDVISIDGSTGEVFAGEVAVKDSPVVQYFEGTMTVEEGGPLVKAVDRLMKAADAKRTLKVRANADNAPDAARARRFGAEGIGLCRTEHMFLGERRELVERLVLADTDEDRQAVFDELLPMQRQDFVEIFEAMESLPVTIRLLDPPLHEFLPDLTELSVKVALAEAKGEVDDKDVELLRHVQRLHEQNPMLGLRGVRLGLAIPGLFEMQSRAILEAAAIVTKNGTSAKPEIMVPLVGAVQELSSIKVEIDRAAEQARAEHGIDLDHMVGTMIELPRAAVTAGDIAEVAEFFSFGTNDLTQTTWGFSRDDVESAFFGKYMEMGIFGVSPFETLDTQGVGKLVEMGTSAGRGTRENLKVGVCGEHGGDPESVHFFHHTGLDYVSCSPFRVPVARLEAGRAAGEGGSDTR